MTSNTSKRLFGTFSGVFLPTVLTILGAILFVRMGWIVGAGGLNTTLAIVSLTTLIALLTTLSISATATNMSIGQGGAYYVLSRTFGLEAGSAIAIPLCLAQGLGISFYLTAFAESVVALWPTLSLPTVSFLSLAGLVTLTLISTRFVLKTQLLIFVIISASLLAVFLGKPSAVASATITAPTPSFWTLFALFFPAFTGIEVGLTMTSELKKPSVSLAVGTLSAIAIGYFIYLAITLFYHTHLPKGALLANPLIMLDIALNKPLVIAGIWGATLSGALSNMLGAPRLLEAFANEGIIPRFVKNRLAIVKIGLIAGFGLLLGGLNQIAPLLTMFFLISYGMINCATGLEAMIGNPSWRPLLHTPWYLSLGGGILCFIVMLMINPATSLCAGAIIFLIFLAMKKRHMASGWEDMRSSILLFFSRLAIYQLAERESTPKNWRPNLLVFLGDPLLRSHLTGLTGALTHKKGFLTMASIVDEEVERARKGLKSYLKSVNFSSLVEVCKSAEKLTGIKEMIETYGLGPLTPNTIVLGVTQKKEKFPLFAELVTSAYTCEKNIMLIRENGLEKRLRLKTQMKRQKQIDVWWGGHSTNNSELMLILAHMLQTSFEWRGSTLNLKSVATKKSELETRKREITLYAESSRLQITPRVVLQKEGEDLFQDTILQSSRDADLVFLGLMPPLGSTAEYASYYASFLKRTENFPPLALVLAGEPLHFREILHPTTETP